MSDLTIYVDTSNGPTLVTVGIPDTAFDPGRTVLILPAAGRGGRNYVIGRMQTRLLEEGYGAVALEYPGRGLSPAGPSDNYSQFQALEEILSWMQRELGWRPSTAAGLCAGARYGLHLAARAPFIEDVFAITCPSRRFNRRLRPGEGEDGFSGRLLRLKGAAARIAQGARGKEDLDSEWLPGIVADIRSASATARLHFLNGDQDRYLTDLRDLMSSGLLNREQLAAIRVELTAGSLRVMQRISSADWISETILENLTQRAVALRG